MWQDILAGLVARGSFRTQSALVKALADAGHVVTQSSVSRELKARNIDKVDGRYVLQVVRGLDVPVPVLDVRASAGPLVVLHTRPAGAPMLAQAVDRAGIRGVAGTLAGDDTVFVACADADAVQRLSGFLGRRIPRDVEQEAR